MRKCPVAQTSRASAGSAPIDRRVVGRAGAQAGERLLDLELEDAGHELGGVAQQLVDAAARSSRCRSPRSSIVAPRYVAAVAARDEVAAVEAQDVLAAARGRPGRAGAATWPLTGRTGTRRRARPTRRRRRDDALGGQRGEVADPAVRARAHARTPARAQAATSARAPGAGSTAWSSGSVERQRAATAPARARARRALGASRRSTARPRRSRSARSRSSVLGLVAVAGHEQRAAARGSRRSMPVTSAELGGERGPAARALAGRARSSVALLRVGLGDRARACPAATCEAPAPRSPRSSSTTSSPRCARAPGDGQADDAAADDGDVTVRKLLMLIASPA